MIWTEDQSSLESFIKHLNSCHNTIKFTAEISPTSINFLDTTVYLNKEGSLDVDLYSKPTDSHNYLLYTSAHTSNCKSSLPHSQFLRVHQICSSLNNFDKHSKILAQHFLRRGFPQDLIDEAYILARRRERDHLLKPLPKTKPQANTTLFLITTYQPQWGGERRI